MAARLRVLRQSAARTLHFQTHIAPVARAVAVAAVPSRPVSSTIFSARHYAVPTNIRAPDQSELEASISRILPSSRYESDSAPSINYEQACSLLSKLLVQLRTTADLASAADRQAYQSSVDADIISSSKEGGFDAQDLSQLANVLLSASADPRRQPLAFRLFQVAHQAGFDDAGYYWASMVLQNTAPPPPSGDSKGRVQEAVTLYQQLSAAGNARGSLGVARLLLQRVQRG